MPRRLAPGAGRAVDDRPGVAAAEEVGVELEKYQGNQGYFLPMAAKFIVGRDGLVKARQVNIEFRERMEPDAIIAALEALSAG